MKKQQVEKLNSNINNKKKWVIAIDNKHKKKKNVNRSRNRFNNSSKSYDSVTNKSVEKVKRKIITKRRSSLHGNISKITVNDIRHTKDLIELRTVRVILDKNIVDKYFKVKEMAAGKGFSHTFDGNSKNKGNYIDTSEKLKISKTDMDKDYELKNVLNVCNVENKAKIKHEIDDYFNNNALYTKIKTEKDFGSEFEIDNLTNRISKSVKNEKITNYNIPIKKEIKDEIIDTFEYKFLVATELQSIKPKENLSNASCYYDEEQAYNFNYNLNVNKMQTIIDKSDNKNDYNQLSKFSDDVNSEVINFYSMIQNSNEKFNRSNLVAEVNESIKKEHNISILSVKTVKSDHNSSMKSESSWEADFVLRISDESDDTLSDNMDFNIDDNQNARSNSIIFSNENDNQYKDNKTVEEVVDQENNNYTINKDMIKQHSITFENSQIQMNLDEIFTNENGSISNKIKFKEDPFINPIEFVNKLLSARVVLKRLPDSIVNSIIGFKCVLINDSQVTAKFISQVSRYCKNCDEITTVRTLYNRNQCDKCKNMVLYLCKNCNKEFTTYYKWKYHMNSKCYPKKYYTCLKCEYKTIIKQHVIRHLGHMHSVAVKDNIKFSSEKKKCKNTNNKKIEKDHRIEDLPTSKNDNKEEIKGKKIEKDQRIEDLPTSKNDNKEEIKGKKIEKDHCIEDLPTSKNDNKEEIKEYIPSKYETKNAIKLYFSNVVFYYCTKCAKQSDYSHTYSIKKCTQCNTVLSIQCKKCKKLYQHYSSMLYHLESTCNPRKHYKCSECNYSTTVTQIWNRHLQSISHMEKKKEKKINVPVTKYQPQEKNYNKTLNSSNLMTRYCSKCNEVKADMSNITIAKDCQKCGASLFYQCIKCKKVSVTYGNIMYHLHTKCQAKTNYKCPKCDFVAALNHLVTQHIKAVHVSPENYKKCMNCGARIKTNKYLIQHMKYCQKEKNTTCTICQKVLPTKYFRLHFRRHQKQNSSANENEIVKDTDSKNLIDKYCPKCRKKNDLSKKISQCEKCRTSLIYHCKKCGSKFSEEKHGCDHMKQYLANLSHVCTNCNKNFSHLENLKKHEMICKIKKI